MDQVHELQTRMPNLSDSLHAVAAADSECLDANVDENDYTVFTLEDLRFELELLSQSITKKIAFIDNQVILLPPHNVMWMLIRAAPRLYPET